ncbi:alpha/beta fold hydrolase [Archangium primigenium]|uniref:alpha/beta fold hydrolase n=1 Tax=[Archangium] primigenium TaxID=2792470 RepID=UPI00195890F2|nr:alpha/beta fold hydrolase [Archangium primigenium]MBM7118535.1 alpha/beta fold hydrolase [Archangium primigenium]
MDAVRWTPWVLGAVLVLGALNLLWIAAVRWWYRLRTPPPELLRARCQDGWELTVYFRRAAQRRYEEPVLLCHGLAANRYTFDFEPPYSLSHALAEAGFDCFIVEWRGIGGSRPPPRGRRWPDVTVDDIVAQDGPALIDLALARTGARRAFWVGHSLGGLVGYAVAQGAHADKLAGLLALGAPVFFPPDRLIRQLIHAGNRASWPRGLRNEWLSRTLAPFLGYVTLPLSDVIINPKHIPPAIQRKVYANMMASMSRNVLRQFRDWIDHDAFRSFDGSVDWRAGLSGLTLPVLVMGGSQDRLAPPKNLRAQFELVGSPDKHLYIFGCERGDKMDYGHGDLLFGTGVAQEVHQEVRTWLASHATPWTEPAEAPTSA